MEAKREVAAVFNELADAIESGQFGSKQRIALTTPGSEHGSKELLDGVRKLIRKRSDIQPVIIGEEGIENFDHHYADCLDDAHRIMEELFTQGEIDGAVTLHYNFPMGVATVGRVISPASGDEMIIATTTGTSATDRVEAMVRNAIAGIASAKAIGIDNPEVGVLNVEGARKVEQALNKLKDNGYEFEFATSARSDGGSVMRGNDLLLGSTDVMVCDTLTGNILMKLFSASQSGGNIEVSGYGYGPGLGPDQDNIIGIVSRASGAPVVAGAMEYMADGAKNDLTAIYNRELKSAEKAGLKDIIEDLKPKAKESTEAVKAPDKKQTGAEIAGIDVLDIETAKETLWAEDIYAETGMGCTGPVIMINEEDKADAKEILKKSGFIG
ncbi:glycine reductase [Halanaerobiaceae bacterium Z-7014]|uniref:Glycine reductase n=1 Tax=Halonatronomonas betaini TaxID=2778430 RepID=A0A931F6S3_9FIRM|nr:glycine/sarcosine/betaine reductase complex component C subunit alpha [Halonatronomonas betaini]MBF8437230.1 glycine reductase [Halonatronomonas betaini]